MRILVVAPDEYLERARPLIEANWRETGFDFELAPDAEAYARLHRAGVLFALAALDGDELVGYCTVVLSRHLFNPGVTVAANDALFVAPGARRSLTAGRLIRVAEDEARDRGASRFAWHCRAGTGLAAMFRAHGYAPADEVVTRSLA